MSKDHKAALAKGRAEGRAVRDYLDALRANKPKRGRKRTPDSIKRRLDAIDEQLAAADALSELRLIQERRNLTDELATMGTGVDLAAVESSFADVAASYSQRHGITYSSWREIGVPAAVLRRAGIARRA